MWTFIWKIIQDDKYAHKELLNLIIKVSLNVSPHYIDDD